jgi:hypothetical protein
VRGGVCPPHPHHHEGGDLGQRHPALEHSQRHELPPRHTGQRAQHETQQDRDEPAQRRDPEPPRGPREPAPPRVAPPRTAQRQRRHGQAEERHQAGVAVHVAGGRRADRPVDLLERDDDHQARAPHRQQRHGCSAPAREPGPDQPGQHRDGPERHRQHPGVEDRLPRSEGVLAQSPPDRVDLLQRDHVQGEHRHDSCRDQRRTRQRPGAGGGGTDRGVRGHGRLQAGVDGSTRRDRDVFPRAADPEA